MECKHQLFCLTPDTYFTSSTPKSILTWSRELVVHLAGRPKDPSFIWSLQSVEGQVSGIWTCTSEKWGKWAKQGWGLHTSVLVGLSYGGGSKVCFWLDRSRPDDSCAPHSIQDSSKSLQDIQDIPWIPSLGIQQCTGWLGILRVNSSLFNSPDADWLPAATAFLLWSSMTSSWAASTSWGRRTKVSNQSMMAHSQLWPSTWEGPSAPSLIRTPRICFGVGV